MKLLIKNYSWNCCWPNIDENEELDDIPLDIEKEIVRRVMGKLTRRSMNLIYQNTTVII